jgi:phosphoserine phosphatase
MIEPLADKLNIPSHRIYANNLLFNSDSGTFSGFDEKEPTSQDGGKAKVVELLKEAQGHSLIVVIGDGVTDMQARPPADLFIGYGGVVVRESVRDGADWFITDFKVSITLIERRY